MFSIAMTLSVISSALRVWLIGRLYWIDRQREYPLFIAYNLVEVLTLVATLCLSYRTTLYFVTYWLGETSSSVLALFVILAIFKPAAETLYIENPTRRFLLPIAAVAVVVIPLWQAIYRPLRPTLRGHVTSGVYSLVLAILCLEALILLACVLLSKSIPWTKYDFAIVSGFGISAVVKCVGYLVRWNFGSRYEDWFQILLPGATLGAVLVWVIAFSRPEPPRIRREPDPSEIQRLTELLQEHTEFVVRILKNPPWRRPPAPDQFAELPLESDPP